MSFSTSPHCPSYKGHAFMELTVWRERESLMKEAYRLMHDYRIFPSNAFIWFKNEIGIRRINSRKNVVLHVQRDPVMKLTPKKMT